MIDPLSSPIAASSLRGMESAISQFQKAAENIAQAPEHPDTVDLSAEMIALLSARDNFMANVEAAKTGDAIQRSLLNLVG